MFYNFMINVRVWWMMLFCLGVFGATSLQAQKTEDIDAIRVALSDKPRDVDLWCQMGNYYLSMGNRDSAEYAFKQALKQDKKSFWAELGLGRVYLELEYKPKKSMSNFEEAIEIDSTQALAFGFLAGAHLEAEENDKAEKMAQKALVLDKNYAPAYLVMARVAQDLDNIPAAMSFYKQYAALSPEDPSPLLKFAQEFLENEQFEKVSEIATSIEDEVTLPLLAQVRMHWRDHENAFALFDTYVKSLPEKEQALYYDVSRVGRAEDNAAYKTVTPENRESFLRAFWLKRDPFKTSGGTMRRVEHYRRVWHARLHFGKKQWPWDKRGDVYVRYGEPDYKSNWREMNANVPLKVQRVQEQIAFQLWGRKGLDVTYVGPVFPIRSERDDVDLNRPLNDPGFSNVGLLGWKPVTVGNEWTAVPWEVWVYADVENGLEVAFTDEYHSGIYDFAPVPNLSYDEIRAVSDRDRGSPLTFNQRITNFSPANRVASVASKEPDRYDISKFEPLNFYYDPLAFRGPDGKTELQIDFGLPIDEVAKGRSGDQASVVVERRFALIDQRNNEVARSLQDMALPLSGAVLGKGLLARDRARLAVSPGQYQLAVQMWRVESDLLGVYQQPIDVYDFSGDQLMLSDLQVAQKIEEMTKQSDPTFVRGKWSIVTSPSRTFRAGDPVYVYFEVYNLKRDEFGSTRYEVSFSVGARESVTQVRIRKDDGESVAVQYEQSGTETWVSDYVELNIGQVKPGRYVLYMNVKDLNSNQSTQREGVFRIVDK